MDATARRRVHVRDMRRLTLLALALSIVSLPLAAATARRRPVASEGFPSCSVINGTPGIAISRDGGRTLIAASQRLSGVGYSYGVAALDTPFTMLSVHKDVLYVSTDAGCNWFAVGPIASDNLATITPAKGGRAYVWGDNRTFLARYENRALTTLRPPADPVGLAADSTGNRVLLGGSNGTVWESLDAGETWTRRGVAPSSVAINYRVAFDPTNIEHLVAGVAGSGAWLSRDGGRTWTQATGFGPATNVFNVVFSKADPNIVWAEGLSTTDSVRHIYRSRDGGASFSVALTESPAIKLINGTVLAPHPTDPNVLYFVFGTYFQAYGTDLYRYDDATKQITTSHFDLDDIDAIAFSPYDPNVMYFGLETERRNAP